jgi:site-specific DNA-methyltransferase (adenine-specific)
MAKEALSATFYKSPGWQKDYPKLQIFTIADLLKGAEVKMPPAFGTFKQAQRADQSGASQGMLEMGDG